MPTLTQGDIVAVITALAMLIFLLVIFIRRLKNNQCNYRMKETMGITVDAKVISWIYMLGRSTRYIVKVEYDTNNGKISKTIVTSGRFAAKYERERDIQVIVIPNAERVYFVEEDWKIQNIVLIIAIMLIVFLLLFLILCLLFWLSVELCI